MKTLRIMTFNMEYGGQYLYEKDESFKYINKYIKLIKRYKLDIVCFQEADFIDPKNKNIYFNITHYIAKKIKYYHHLNDNEDSGLSIISRFPIIKKYKKGTGIQIKINNQNINIFNIHPVDAPCTYCLYRSHKSYKDTPKGLSKQQSVNLSYKHKKKDLDEIFINKNVLKEPTIIMGDFNEPSHLDWPVDLPWKLSSRLYKNNFHDIVREFYPNVKKYPMYTCDIERKETITNAPERIDFIYHNQYLKSRRVKYILGTHFSDHIPIFAELSF